MPPDGLVLDTIFGSYPFREHCRSCNRRVFDAVSARCASEAGIHISDPFALLCSFHDHREGKALVESPTSDELGCLCDLVFVHSKIWAVPRGKIALFFLRARQKDSSGRTRLESFSDTGGDA